MIRRQARRRTVVGYGASSFRLTGAHSTSTDVIQDDTRWGAPPPPGRIPRAGAINTDAAPPVSPASPPLDPTSFISEPSRVPPTTPAMPPPASGSASRWVNPAKEYELRQRRSPGEASLRSSAFPYPVEQYVGWSHLSCTEGDEVGSPSGRAPRVRGAGVDSGDHPWGNRHGVRASNAVGRLRKKGESRAQEGRSGKDSCRAKGP